MKISLKWLNDYVDVSNFLKTPEKLADILTLKGLEVESVENKSKDFENVVVGLILERGQHPNADRLTLCQVSTGNGVVHQIVCGAKNHKQGDRVVVALPGAVLPGNFEIKLSKIRNVESQGMLCSEKELGLSQESEGIVILPEDAPVGKPFAEYKGLDDIIFELKVTPNRADCLSHYGLAREVACILDLPLKKDFKINLKTNSESSKKKISVDVQNPELCPRYSGRYVANIKIQKSPDWLRQKLESIGMKSINNVIDITNFVMMELGQPLHAFDAELIAGGQIIVSQSQAGEKFKTLDGTELTLKGSELLIRDGEKPVALAGVVGGQNSGIRDQTKNIFIESAFFTPETVRKTSRLHGVNTESSYRFSRGVDANGTATAMDRCAQLVQELAGGDIYGDAIDTNPHPLKPITIALKTSDVTERLGFEAKSADITLWMKRLGAQVTTNGDTFTVMPPSYRSDILIKEDLIEEFARLYGYEHIPEKLPQTNLTPAPHATAYTLMQKVSRQMRAEGFSEAFNYAFVDSVGHSKFVTAKTEAIKIKNPLSEEYNVMRQTLAYGLFKNAVYNLRHELKFGRLFEVGFAFEKSGENYNQTQLLSLVSWGLPEGLWQKETRDEVLFFETKTHLENILKSFAIKSWSWEKSDEHSTFLHPGQSAKLKVEGKLVGFVGKIHPTILDDEKIRSSVVVSEINLDLVLQGQPRVQRIKSFSKNPRVERDLAFVMPGSLEVSQVISEIQKVAQPFVKSVVVFDVYQDEALKKEDKRSVAFRMIYQSPDKTFTDQELAGIDKKLVDAMSHKFSIQVR